MITSFENLSKLREQHKNKKIVFAGGTFDLIHAGHIEFLKSLRTFGDIVVVGISSNKRVQQRKGNSRPILDENERLAIVEAIKYVDYVFISPSFSSEKDRPTIEIIKTLLPDIFVTIDSRWLEYKNKVEQYGARLEFTPVEKINSTTAIIRKIHENHTS